MLTIRQDITTTLLKRNLKSVQATELNSANELGSDITNFRNIRDNLVGRSKDCQIKVFGFVSWGMHQRLIDIIFCVPTRTKKVELLLQVGHACFS